MCSSFCVPFGVKISDSGLGRKIQDAIILGKVEFSVSSDWTFLGNGLCPIRV